MVVYCRTLVHLNLRLSVIFLMDILAMRNMKKKTYTLYFMTHLFVFVELLMRPHYLILSYSVDSMVFSSSTFILLQKKYIGFLLLVFLKIEEKNSTHTYIKCMLAWWSIFTSSKYDGSLNEPCVHSNTCIERKRNTIFYQWIFCNAIALSLILIIILS